MLALNPPSSRTWTALVFGVVHRHHVLGGELAFEDRAGHQVLDLLLDTALQRSCAEPPGRSPRWQSSPAPHLGHVRCHVHACRARLQPLQLDAGDGLDVLLVQRVEHHQLRRSGSGTRAGNCAAHLLPDRLPFHPRPAARRTSTGSGAKPGCWSSRSPCCLRNPAVRPWPSVGRPSSSACSSTLNTSGCAFSASSSRITAYSLRRTASVR